jgi:hypothetical protein
VRRARHGGVEGLNGLHAGAELLRHVSVPRVHTAFAHVAFAALKRGRELHQRHSSLRSLSLPCLLHQHAFAPEAKLL